MKKVLSKDYQITNGAEREKNMVFMKIFLDFLTVGSMGHAASIGLGICLGSQGQNQGQRKRNVFILDGDGLKHFVTVQIGFKLTIRLFFAGSMIMHLGILTTIAQ